MNAKYALLLINPSIERLDSVVIGALFRRGNTWDVRVAASPAKMQAVNPAFPSSKLLQTAQLFEELVQSYSDFKQLRDHLHAARLGVCVDRFVGAFTYTSDVEYHAQVAEVLRESVNPPTLAQSNPSPITRRRNVIRRRLRTHFTERGLWSRHHDDINQHKVVEQYPVLEESGVYAEFALRNGAMHITETIDFQVQSLQGKRLAAQAKALVLTEATRVFGENTRRYVVSSGSTREDARQSVHLLQEFATNMFALESDQDMAEYAALIAAAAAQPNLP